MAVSMADGVIRALSQVPLFGPLAGAFPLGLSEPDPAPTQTRLSKEDDEQAWLVNASRYPSAREFFMRQDIRDPKVYKRFDLLNSDLHGTRQIVAFAGLDAVGRQKFWWGFHGYNEGNALEFLAQLTRYRIFDESTLGKRKGWEIVAARQALIGRGGQAVPDVSPGPLAKVLEQYAGLMRHGEYHSPEWMGHSGRGAAMPMQLALSGDTAVKDALNLLDDRTLADLYTEPFFDIDDERRKTGGNVPGIWAFLNIMGLDRSLQFYGYLMDHNITYDAQRYATRHETLDAMKWLMRGIETGRNNPSIVERKIHDIIVREIVSHARRHIFHFYSESAIEGSPYDTY